MYLEFIIFTYANAWDIDFNFFIFYNNCCDSSFLIRVSLSKFDAIPALQTSFASYKGNQVLEQLSVPLVCNERLN